MRIIVYEGRYMNENYNLDLKIPKDLRVLCSYI